MWFEVVEFPQQNLCVITEGRGGVHSVKGLSQTFCT